MSIRHGVAAALAAAGVGLLGPGVAHAGTIGATMGATPCSPSARACVDLSLQRAWLTDGHGRVIDGPVPVRTGEPGVAPTTVGTFAVQWKDIDHKSHEFHGAPMPYSVFFHDGEAFHQGSLHRYSAGCVHLTHAAAKEFYHDLHVGDEVQIVP